MFFFCNAKAFVCWEDIEDEIIPVEVCCANCINLISTDKYTSKM